MTSIAVQTAVGAIGSKATTELSYAFASMVNLGSFQFGANADGLFLLNSTNKDNDVVYERSLTFATTSFNIYNPKRGRFIYIGIDTDVSFTVSVKFDNQDWRDYPVELFKTGLQRLKVSIGRNGQGKYFTLKITSNSWFRLDSVEGAFVIRPIGIRSN